MKNEEIKKLLNAEALRKNKEKNYVARWGFFYTHGRTSKTYEDKVKERIPTATIINSGQKWVPFHGGDTVTQGSHFWVEFKIGE